VRSILVSIQTVSVALTWPTSIISN
jgi:hypothetical protein